MRWRSPRDDQFSWIPWGCCVAAPRQAVEAAVPDETVVRFVQRALSASARRLIPLGYLLLEPGRLLYQWNSGPGTAQPEGVACGEQGQDDQDRGVDEMVVQDRVAGRREDGCPHHHHQQCATGRCQTH